MDSTSTIHGESHWQWRRRRRSWRAIRVARCSLALFSTRFWCCLLLPKIRVDDTKDQAFGKQEKSAAIVNFSIQFSTREWTGDSSSNGQCWHNMFRNPVVVDGYPILPRAESTPGIDIPLNMMTNLTGTRKIDIFGDRIYVKGFSAMAVPTKRLGDLLIWHFFHKEDNKYFLFG